MSLPVHFIRNGPPYMGEGEREIINDSVSAKVSVCMCNDRVLI